MPPKFSIGDLVRLKSGGPVMTIDKRALHVQDESVVTCKWFNSRDLIQSSQFATSALIVVEDNGAKFEIYKDKSKQWRFRLKAGNSEIIAVSEAYKTKQACTKGIESVQRNALGAAIVEASD